MLHAPTRRRKWTVCQSNVVAFAPCPGPGPFTLRVAWLRPWAGPVYTKTNQDPVLAAPLTGKQPASGSGPSSHNQVMFYTLCHRIKYLIYLICVCGLLLILPPHVWWLDTDPGRWGWGASGGVPVPAAETFAALQEVAVRVVSCARERAGGRGTLRFLREDIPRIPRASTCPTGVSGSVTDGRARPR